MMNKNHPHFYILGTKYGRVRDVLPQMLTEKVISIGYDGDLDLSPIIGAGYAKALNWIKTQIPDKPARVHNTLTRFAGMKPGDLVALKAHSAPSGNRPRLIVARYAVVVGDDKAIYVRSENLGQTLQVEFLEAQEPIEFALGYGQTLHAIKDSARINKIFGRYAQIAKSVSEVTLAKRKATHTNLVDGRRAYFMRRVHNEIQNEIYERLLARHGVAAVKQEESHVDLMVHLENKTLLIEVKSSLSPISCLREALGQLLQYSWKLDFKGDEVEYLVVGPSVASENDCNFVEYVSRETGLILNYCNPDTFDERYI